MKITKAQLNQIIKEELAGVLEEAKKTPEWSSDYYRGVGRSRAGRGKSAHGHKEDPFTSPIRYVKGKLGMPRDKIEKFKKRHNITTGGEIGDKALVWALAGGRRGSAGPGHFKKTMKAMKQDQRRTMDALERLSSVVDKPDPEHRYGKDHRDEMSRISDRKWDAKEQYIDTINKIIAGERG